MMHIYLIWQIDAHNARLSHLDRGYRVHNGEQRTDCVGRRVGCRHGGKVVAYVPTLMDNWIGNFSTGTCV